ncbi:MAG: cytidine deaminase [Propionibacteriaceae bacterium]|nr:cytidine deaminase [Propionibacteriaceae bacterium]
MTTELTPGDDWLELRQAAVASAGLAYAPYSNYPVGAAARTSDGRMLSGCNVENASYGLTLCAEAGLISALFAAGGGRLAQFCCVDGAGHLITPCGRCRQLLWEHGGPDLIVWSPAGLLPMTELLPQAWGFDD